MRNALDRSYRDRLLNFWPQLFSNVFGEPSKFKTLCSSASYQFEQVFNESKTIRVSEILPLEISNLVLYRSFEDIANT